MEYEEAYMGGQLNLERYVADRMFEPHRMS